MKKVLAILLAAVLLFSLVACGGQDEKASDAEPVAESESAEADADVPEAEAEPEEDIADVLTYEEYLAADLDSEVTVDVYVQAHQSWWEDKITVYAADKDGAYFIYNMACSEEDAAKLEPGALIRVHGFKAEWSGEIEISDADFEFATGAEPYIAEPEDVTALLGTDELADKMNAFVSFKGMTVVPSVDADENEAPFLYNWDGSGTPGNDLYFNVQKGEDVYTFTVESYLCGQDTDVYKAVEALEVGDVIDMEGFLYWYNGPNPHITSVTPAEADDNEDAAEGDAEDDAEFVDYSAKSEGVMTYAEYAAAELDTEVTVEVFVQDHQSWWEDKITVYAADPDGAYFIYELACSEEDAKKLEPGTKIKVTGFKSQWSGEVEIIDGTFEFCEEGSGFLAAAMDVTPLLGNEALELFMNQTVMFMNLTVVPSEDADGNEAPFLYNWDGSGEPGNDLYFNVQAGDDVYTFTVESYLRDQDSDVYKAVEALEIGDKITIFGYLYWYNGPNPHVIYVIPSDAEISTKSEGVMDWYAYNAAELDSEVTIEAYVMDTQSWWEDKITVYAADADGAYFIYNMACSEEDAENLTEGTKIRVTGYKSEWSGEIEISDATFEFVDAEGPYMTIPVDVTKLLGNDALALYMNRNVEFTGLTIVASEDADGNEAPFLYNWDGSGTPGNDLYFNAQVGDAVYTFTVESYLRGQDTDVYQAVEALEIGDVIDIEAYLYWYNGPNPHVISVNVR